MNKRKQTNNSKRAPVRKTVRKQSTKDRPDHPGEISGYEITHSRRLRFTVTAATLSKTITYQNLLDTILFASTAIAPFDVFDLVKINWVKIWGQAALGTPSSVMLQYVTATGDQSIHQDTSLGIKPAYIHAVPSPRSLASFFQLSNAGNAFTFSAPAGSVIDLSLTFKDIPSVGTAAQNASVGAGVGSIFYRGLDGLASAGTNLPVPAGVQTF